MRKARNGQVNVNDNVDVDFEVDVVADAPDPLTLDALDGALTADGQRDWQALLDRDAGARAAFERMAALDRGLRAAPMAAPPAPFVGQVMAAVGRARTAGPVLNWRQAAFLAVAGAALALLAAALALGAVAELAPEPAASALQALRVFWWQSTQAARGMLQVAAALVRGVYAAPAAWLVTAVLLAAVVAWICVMAGALAPRERLSRAA
jgi:hypothetical protein